MFSFASLKADFIFIPCPKMSQRINVKFKTSVSVSILSVLWKTIHTEMCKYCCTFVHYIWKYLEPRCWIFDGITTKNSTGVWEQNVFGFIKPKCFWENINFKSDWYIFCDTLFKYTYLSERCTFLTEKKEYIHSPLPLTAHGTHRINFVGM